MELREVEPRSTGDVLTSTSMAVGSPGGAAASGGTGLSIRAFVPLGGNAHDRGGVLASRQDDQASCRGEALTPGSLGVLGAGGFPVL